MEGMGVEGRGRSVLLEKLIDIDNQALLLHRRELTNYLKREGSSLVSIEVDLTLSCNHFCPNCTFKKRQNNKVFLNTDILNKILKALPQIGAKGMIITGGGEPCIHKELGNFVKSVSAAGIDVTLTTNGQFIHRHFNYLMHNLKRIRFSIDAASYRTFEYTHGSKQKDFEQIIDNLRNAVRYKKEQKLPIDIGVSFLLCKENAYEIASAIDFYREIGVNFLHFKPMQLWDNKLRRYYYKNYPEANDIFLKLKSYRENDFRVSISRENYYRKYDLNIGYSKCHGAHFNMIVGADANVYTCCHFKYNLRYCYGNLLKEEFEEILKKVKSKITKDCFSNCKMDSLNQFVEFAKTHQEPVLNVSKELNLKELPLGSKWL